MRLLMVASLLATSAVSAHAQMHPQTQEQPEGFARPNAGANRRQQQEAIEKYRRAQEDEKAYGETVKRIPLQKPVDPWAKTR